MGKKKKKDNGTKKKGFEPMTSQIPVVRSNHRSTDRLLVTMAVLLGSYRASNRSV